MSAAHVPADVRRLLLERVRGYEQLEALLVLFAAPGRGFSAAEVAARLHIPEASAEDDLVLLARSGLAMTLPGVPPQFRYLAESAELDALVRRMAALYEERRVEMVMILAEGARQRIRSAAIHAFAESFRFRKDE